MREKNMRKLGIFFGLMLFVSSVTAQTVGLSISSLDNPFFLGLQEGAQAVAANAGVKLLVADAQDGISTQVSDIEDLLQRGVDVLIINPTDSDAIVPVVMAANAANVPVIAVDRRIAGGMVAYSIASDNEAGGASAAQHMCDVLGGSGKVVELEGIPGVSATNERGRGFNDYLAAYCGGLEVVVHQTANFNRAEGRTVMENILMTQSEIAAVFAHNDEMALGALQAIEASGRDIMVVGFDATAEAVEAVNTCRMAATVAQLPSALGEEAVNVALAIVNDNAPVHMVVVAVALELVTNTKCF